jgi:hypothetical protein
MKNRSILLLSGLCVMAAGSALAYPVKVAPVTVYNETQFECSGTYHTTGYPVEITQCTRTDKGYNDLQVCSWKNGDYGPGQTCWNTGGDLKTIPFGNSLIANSVTKAASTNVDFNDATAKVGDKIMHLQASDKPIPVYFIHFKTDTSDSLQATMTDPTTKQSH